MLCPLNVLAFEIQVPLEFPIPFRLNLDHSDRLLLVLDESDTSAKIYTLYSSLQWQSGETENDKIYRK